MPQLFYLWESCKTSRCVCMWELFSITGHPLANRQPQEQKACPSCIVCLLSSPQPDLFTSQQSHWLRNRYSPPERKYQTEFLPFLCLYLCRPGCRWLWQGNSHPLWRVWGVINATEKGDGRAIWSFEPLSGKYLTKWTTYSMYAVKYKVRYNDPPSLLFPNGWTFFAAI